MVLPSTSDNTTLESGPKSGIIERTLSRLILQPWQIAATVNIASSFRIIDFARKAPMNRVWTAGSKVQIKLDGGFITRTYTPIVQFDDPNFMRIVAYIHGPGPGSDWARSAQVGEIRPIFGPRNSLDLSGISGTCVLVGDETSVGLAAVLVSSTPGEDHRLIFEASDPFELRAVLHQCGLRGAIVIKRQKDGSHRVELTDAVQNTPLASALYLLTGGAPSIQYVGRALRQKGVTRQRIRSKVYWAPGKAGLD